MVGLVMSYALTINGYLNSVIFSFTETEREFVSVERMVEYIRGDRDGTPPLSLGAYGGVRVIQREGGGGGAIASSSAPTAASSAPLTTSSAHASLSPASHWPQHNTIRFEGVYLKYRPYHPFALRNVSFRVGANEKVGILGRTGAGKSSIFTALFRLTELSSGAIYIDNVDIAGLSLQRLRMSMAVVPQNPPLFSGTVRKNVDPFGRHTDSAIWSAIKACYVHTALREAVVRAKQIARQREIEDQLAAGLYFLFHVF